MSEGILSGITVLDLSQFISGPRCTQLLAMKGARVVKIEPPIGEAMRLLCRLMNAERMMSTLHADKNDIVIDLKKPEGIELYLKLVDKADVVVENFAPGMMDRMGIGWDVLRERNPRLVYAAISGFGRTGPLADRVAFDIVSQATGGIMSAYKMEHCPPRVFFGDQVSGAFCALGVVEALLARERDGKGRLVDISMQDVMYFHNFGAYSERALGPVQEAIRNTLGRNLTHLLTDETNPLPFWNSYRASDGYVVLVALTDREWGDMLRAMGLEDMLTDPRFSNFVTRIQNAAPCVERIAGWVAERTVAEVVDILSAARVPCAPVMNYDQVNNDPQLAARGMLADARMADGGTVAVPGDPIHIEGESAQVESACPGLGANTREVLGDLLGMADEEFAALKKLGVVR